MSLKLNPRWHAYYDAVASNVLNKSELDQMFRELENAPSMVEDILGGEEKTAKIRPSAHSIETKPPLA